MNSGTYLPVSSSGWQTKIMGSLRFTAPEEKGAFAKAEQAIIWSAVEGWLAQHKIGFTGRLPKVTIIGRQSTYWCFVKDKPWVGIGSSPADAYRQWSFAVSAQSRNNINANEYLEVRSVTL